MVFGRKNLPTRSLFVGRDIIENNHNAYEYFARCDFQRSINFSSEQKSSQHNEINRALSIVSGSLKICMPDERQAAVRLRIGSSTHKQFRRLSRNYYYARKTNTKRGSATIISKKSSNEFSQVFCFIDTLHRVVFSIDIIFLFCYTFIVYVLQLRLCSRVRILFLQQFFSYPSGFRRVLRFGKKMSILAFLRRCLCIFKHTLSRF